ncbi:MAG TPA: penicillin-binding transpeptidase domain-containing protein [Acidimicrobiales bacterium]|nr:penicillin-binding transpeptidase domain-containing protein [Acidimicrobiales bacterium]
MGRRVRWLGLVMILCFTLVLVQLVNIQFRQAPALNKSSDNPRTLVDRYDNQRGDILAADGSVLARSVTATAGSYHYQRVYPGGAAASLYSDVVGYSSILYGTSGVEYQYNGYLVAHSQPARSLSQLLSPAPKTADNVTVTLQPYLQQVAQQAVARIPSANKDAAVVALDPRTGAVLAMYSNPNFDPNPLASPDAATQDAARYTYLQPDGEGFVPLVSLATQARFFPGSTSKVVTSAAVYDLKPGLIDFSYPSDPQNSCLKLPNSDKQLCNEGTDVTNSIPCGGTMVQMLPASCDPGYGELGIQLGGDLLSRQAALFGYNSVPPIDLPGVVPSAFPAAAQLTANQAFLAYSSIGQFDVQATALQNAMIAAGIANGGVVMVPHVMAQIRQSDGTLVKSYTPSVYQRAVSARTAAQVTSLMQSVAKPGGTAAGVGFSPSLNVAVKTGTAQTSATAPPASANVDWMIGFAPADSPVVAVAVVVPKQSQTSDGAGIAGPIMNAVLSAALAHAAGS